MAGIQITSGFQLNSALPLDLRSIQVDITSRDAIPSNQRYELMEVSVLSDKKKYQLQGGILNTDWKDIGALDLTQIEHDYQIVKDVIGDSSTLTPINGDKYLVATGGAVDFTGKDGSIATYKDGAWIFTTKKEGLKVYNVALHKVYVCDQTLTWVEDKPVIDHKDLTNVQGGSATEAYHLTKTEHDTVVAIDPTKLVHTENDETISGVKTFNDNVELKKDLVITGNLQINGTTTKIETQDLLVKDSKITLNDGLATGTPTVNVGIEALLGDNGKAVIEYNVTDSKWKIGKEGSMLPVASLDDTTLTSVNTTLSAKIIVDTIDAKISAGSTQDFVSDGIITANNVVYLTIDGKAKIATSDIAFCADRILGIATNSVIDGETVKVAKVGTVTGLTGLDTSKGLFLTTNGGVTQTLPIAGFIHKIGIVKSATEFVIDIADYSILL